MKGLRISSVVRIDVGDHNIGTRLSEWKHNGLGRTGELEELVGVRGWWWVLFFFTNELCSGEKGKEQTDKNSETKNVSCNNLRNTRPPLTIFLSVYLTGDAAFKVALATNDVDSLKEAGDQPS